MTKERYLFLKHLCRNYDRYERVLEDIYSCDSSSLIKVSSEVRYFSNVLAKRLDEASICRMLIGSIRFAISNCKFAYRRYLFDGVTKGISYNKMSEKEKLPFSRKEYYAEYKRYFELLNHELDKRISYICLS